MLIKLLKNVPILKINPRLLFYHNDLVIPEE